MSDYSRFSLKTKLVLAKNEQEWLIFKKRLAISMFTSNIIFVRCELDLRGYESDEVLFIRCGSWWENSEYQNIHFINALRELISDNNQGNVFVLEKEN